jgi:hypothetical protein
MKIHYLVRQLIFQLKGVKPLNGMSKEEYEILSKVLLKDAGLNSKDVQITSERLVTNNQ